MWESTGWGNPELGQGAMEAIPDRMIGVSESSRANLDEGPRIVIDLRDVESTTAAPAEPAGDRWRGVDLVSDDHPRPAYWLAKRALDVVAVLLVVPVAVPVVLLLALAIKLDSPGPVLFRQERIGARRVRTDRGLTWRLRSFQFLKLRTMYHDSDPSIHEQYMSAYISGDEGQMSDIRSGVEGTYKMELDPRITRVGKTLRRLSLDELPQLWNILVGQMSIVGPRPPIPYEVEKYAPSDLRRLGSVPGLTGWWQVNGRSETTFEEMIALDLEYLRRQSLGLDLQIILKTLPAALEGRGAG